MTKPYKVFISYTHADKIHLESLRNHFAVLERNGVVDLWCDKEIGAGDELEKEIIEKLNESDIFIFLVSSDFLASYYCIEVELEGALKKYDDGKARVIPIIIRDCDWKGCELSKFKVLPEDGKAVSSHSNLDGAWAQCIDEIRNALKKINHIVAPVNFENKVEAEGEVSSDFSEWLDNTEIVFQHRNKDEISLKDVFVYPDLGVMEKDDIRSEVVIPAASVIDFEKKFSAQTLILGSEQSGKTSLAKRYFFDSVDKNALPLFVDGYSVATTIDIPRTISSCVKEQYVDLDLERFTLSKKHKIAIIDNFEGLKFNLRYTRVFIERLFEVVDQMVVFCDAEIKYTDDRIAVFDEYEKLEIFLFGYLKREEVISKWNSIGVLETIPESELGARNDSSTMQVDSIIRKNVVPAKPIFILSILQSLESGKPSDFSLTSYGHCYQKLIADAFLKANIKFQEFTTYYNYLTQLANEIYVLGSYGIAMEELDGFKKKYSKVFIIDSHEEILNKLIESKILKQRNDRLYFGYKYIFYFYVAKYVAENITRRNSKKILSSLCEKIHAEKHANILIFITHHSKDQVILDEILMHASVIFDGRPQATLQGREIDRLRDTLEALPGAVIEQKNVDEEKHKQLAARDAIDKPGPEESIEEIQKEEELDSDFLSDINKSYRMIEVIGQIVRNRHGDLTKNELRDLINAGLGAGLRFLDFYIDLHSELEEETIDYVAAALGGVENLNDDEVGKTAKSIYLRLLYIVSFAVCRKLSFSMGAARLRELYDEVALANADSASIQLVNLTIQLEFGSNIPFKLIESLAVTYKDNILVRRLIEHIAIQHLYLHHTTIEEKQRLSAILGLPIREQRRLENQSEPKSLKSKK